MSQTTNLENEKDATLTASNQQGCTINSSNTEFVGAEGNQLLLNRGKEEVDQNSFNVFSKSTRIVRSPILNVPNVSRYNMQLKTTTAVATTAVATTPHVNNNNPQSEEIIKALAESRQENKELNTTIRWLQEHVKLLEEEVKKLKVDQKMGHQNVPEVPMEKGALNRGNTGKETKSAVYQTDSDSEELENETNWMFKRSNKFLKRQKKQEVNSSNKRKAESSPEMDTSANVSVAKVTQLSTTSKPKKEKPPPPINITHVDKFSVIHAIMKEVTEKEYKLVSLNNNVWKVNMPDPDGYRKLSTVLNDKGLQWYTYEDKNTRPIRVVVRGLHQSCTTDEIIEDLKCKDLMVLDAVNMVKTERKSTDNGGSTIIKRKLPLFTLTFANSEKIENIYNIRNIMGMVVRIEPLKKVTGIIPQCKNCQAYNHTKKYCNRETRCVKCAGKHDTKDCKIEKNTPAKCINCHGTHPASYRGCEVAKTLQNMRNRANKKQPMRATKGKQKEIPIKTATTFDSVKVTEGFSYSQAARQGLAQPPGQNAGITQAMSTMQNTLNAIVNRLTKIEENIESLNQRQVNLQQQVGQQEKLKQISSKHFAISSNLHQAKINE